jgi:hypothetical protein
MKLVLFVAIIVVLICFGMVIGAVIASRGRSDGGDRDRRNGSR